MISKTILSWDCYTWSQIQKRKPLVSLALTCKLTISQNDRIDILSGNPQSGPVTAVQHDVSRTSRGGRISTKCLFSSIKTSNITVHLSPQNSQWCLPIHSRICLIQLGLQRHSEALLPCFFFKFQSYLSLLMWTLGMTLKMSAESLPHSQERNVKQFCFCCIFSYFIHKKKNNYSMVDTHISERHR